MSINEQNRRRFLQYTSAGVSAYALSSLLHSTRAAPIGLPQLHHPAKAKSVILLYMSGGVSHVDSFDPKPLLTQMQGKPMPGKIERTQFDAVGNILGSPWKTDRYGQSGLELAGLFPRICNRADDLAVVRSMTANFSEHAQANFFLHTGFPFLGHPSAGAWIAYGLGAENPTLPPYVVLRTQQAGIPHGGVSMFGNGFLPAAAGGSIFNLSGRSAVPNLAPRRAQAEQREALRLLKTLDTRFADRVAAEQAVRDSVKNAETAFAMQQAVPELTDISGESQATLDLYGVESQNPHTSQYARQCLMARRLVERGVRCVELTCSSVGIGLGGGANPWDQHADIFKGHGAMAEQVDQPIAALLQDLKQRDMLDSTLVVFTGEFGRTPFAQGNGRDHNPFGFSLWLAGGGLRGGMTHGATDEFGYHAVEQPVTVYDLWATVLHQLGIDHERLTYRYSGRDMRLTDVHGNVWKELIA
ncbi:DUF1501 domain-containing protein [Lignipirellula cremea]|uniref:Sulfatase n=1 Tax=Lignipirellula cremea TaxID=2528010 RepID=A0A518DLS0_9BACT|nr:DUF1501 domain-containing protein [Lignipirellula cremea]QDU92790.1 hypothetical protein Pla8534_05630 [Lignipirellula cremea]